MTSPFSIHVPDTTIADLRARLERTRWPHEVVGGGWEYGVNADYLKELVDYWRRGFDWRKQETRLNDLAQFKTEIDGHDVHFVHRLNVACHRAQPGHHRRVRRGTSERAPEFEVRSVSPLTPSVPN